MKIELGKTYIARNGREVTIEAETSYHGTWRMRGVDKQGRLTWYAVSGRFDRYPGPLDLIAELQ